MPSTTLGSVEIFAEWPSFSFWSAVDLPADWLLGPARSTTTRSYSGQIIDWRNIGLRIGEGALKDWGFSVGRLQVFDREWVYAIPDNVYASDIRLTAPELIEWRSGNIGEMGSIAFELQGASGIGHYLTLLPGINSGTSPALAEDNARLLRLQKATEPYLTTNWLGQTVVREEAYRDPEVIAALEDVSNNVPDRRLQGLFTLEARSARFELFDEFTISVSGSDGVPGFSADYSIDYDPFSETDRLLDNRSSIRLEGLSTSLSIGGTPLFSLRSASVASGPDVVMRAGNWGLQPDDPLLRIESLSGELTLLPFSRPDGQVVYPRLELSGLEIQQDEDISLEGAVIEIPQGAVSSLGLAGIVPLELRSLGLAFARMPDGNVDLRRPTLSVAGGINTALLQQQLRELTGSPALTLEIRHWVDGGTTLLTPEQTLSLAVQIDAASGALRVLNAPALRLDLRDLVLPLPGGEQPILSGSLILGGTDGSGDPQAIPEALLAQAGVPAPLPGSVDRPQAVLAGEILSADGSSRATALLSGRLTDHARGSSLQLNGGVRLDGALLADGFQLGGAVEAMVQWRLDAERRRDGGLRLSGFPTVEGIGLENLTLEVGGLLRCSVDQLAWTAGPTRDPRTGRDGLLARARGLNLEILAGALAGNSFRSTAAEVLLFDLHGADGVPDHVFIDGLELALAEARLGPLAAEGLRLRVRELTNLPDPGTGLSTLQGSITLEADGARLLLGETLQGRILPAAAAPAEAEGPPEPLPALRGSLDLSSGDLALELQRLEAALTVAGQSVLELAAGATALQLRADAAPDDHALSIASLLGRLPLFGVESAQGHLAPAVQVEAFAVQEDGDVEMGAITLTLPEGYRNQWNLAGLLPLELQELRLRFDTASDGSIDPKRAQLGLSGIIDMVLLERQLQQLLNAPELRLNLWSIGRDGVQRAIDAAAPISLEARIDGVSGSVTLLNSPGWRLQLSGLPMPIPGESQPLLAGDLLLPGSDATGNALPLPGPLVTQLLAEAGSLLDPAAVLAGGPELIGVLRGSFRGADGGSTSLFGADGSLLLSGSLHDLADGGNRLSLIGEASLTSVLNLPGLSAGADLNTTFSWDLLSEPTASGGIRRSGTPRLSGALVEDLRFGLDGLLEASVDRLIWQREPQADRVAGRLTGGLIARAEGLRLAFLSGPLNGLAFGSATSELRLYDLEGGRDGLGDGVADHLYLDGPVVELRDLNLDWLAADSLQLVLGQLSDLPALDPDPDDGNSLSGRVGLELRGARVGDGLSIGRAGGVYDLSVGVLELAVDDLLFREGSISLSGGGRLRIDPDQPAERWLELQAAGRFDLGIPGLQPLDAELALALDQDLNPRSIEGQLMAADGGLRLGDLQVPGSLRFAYDALMDQATLEGSVNLVGVDAQASIRFSPGEPGFEATLQVSRQSSLQLAEWLQLRPSDLELLYSYDPGRGGRLTLNGDAALTLLGREVAVAADLQVGYGGPQTGPVLLGGSLQLGAPLEGLVIGGFRVDLIADQAGQLPGIRLVNTAEGLKPRLSGALRLRDLQDLTIQLDPASGGITHTSNGWSFETFDLDLTPSGPLNLGLLQLGDDASIRHADGLLTLDPDLSLNGELLGRVIAPVARVIDNTVTPLTQPLINVLKAEINIDALRTLEAYKPGWVWSWTWEPVADTGRDLHRTLLKTLEGTPGNPFVDGRVQVVELLDTAGHAFHTLLKQNPSLGRALAQQLGLPDSYINAVLSGAPYISLASGVQVLEAIGDLAEAVVAAEAAASAGGAGSLVPVPDLRFQLRPGALAETLGSIGPTAREDSAVVRALLDVQAAWQRGEGAGGTQAGSADGSALFSVRPALDVPVLDDPLAAVLALFKGETIDLIAFGLGLDASLSFEINQSIPVAIGPIVLPLVLGGRAQLSGELNASLGLTTSAAALRDFGADVSAAGGLVDLAAAVGELLAPADAEALGLYLAGEADQPLLRLVPQIRIQGGLEAGVGARAFAGIQGSLEVQLADERLYLGQLVNTLSGDTPPTPEQLARLFSFDASLSALFGIDTKIFSWENLLQRTVPLYNLSVPRVTAGPVVDGEVLLDLRGYVEAGGLRTNLNLRPDAGEPLSRTDAQGSYRLTEPLDPDRSGNRDGVLDYRDGMVIAGQRSGDGTGEGEADGDGAGRIRLVDSLSGVDLGIPLVGLPGGNLNLLTTLKYTNLLRWRPGANLAGRDLTPELITEVFTGIVRNAPDTFRNDDFQPYQALASDDPQTAQLGLDTVIFTYQHLAGVLTVLELLQRFRLDYSDVRAWGFTPDPQGIDSPEVVAFGAYGRAIRSRFGSADGSGLNPLDPLKRPPLAPQFDVAEPEHLKALMREVLLQYPTERLFEVAQAGGSGAALREAFLAQGRTDEQQALVESLVDAAFTDQLTRIGTGLSAIVATIDERIRVCRELSNLIPVPGPQLLMAAIAGPKRLVVSELIPSLLDTSELSESGAFEREFFQRFFRPQPVDAPGRSSPFLISASAGAGAILPALALPVTAAQRLAVINVSLSDAQGRPVEAPDYGLTIRFRLGGSAKEGADYRVPEAFTTRVIYVPPGASGASLEIELLPDFAGAGRLLQVELLSADSGYRVADGAAVVSLSSSDSALDGLDGSRASFQPHRLVQQNGSGTASMLRAPANGSNTVLRGRDGHADRYVLQPDGVNLPHIETLRPQEGDQLLIDLAALQAMRSDPTHRRPSEQARAEALQRLEDRLGRRAVQSLGTEQLRRRLEPILEAIEPLPALSRDQLNTYGGVLFDRASQRPLALLSDDDVNGDDRAWSSYSADPRARLLRFSLSETDPEAVTAIRLETPAAVAGVMVANLLIGTAERDRIIGGSAADLISGGPGADQVRSGVGGDVVLFRSGTGLGAGAADRLTDFNPAQGDRLAFDAALIDGEARFGLTLTRDHPGGRRGAFRSGEALVYERSTGRLFLDDNGVGPGLGESGGLLAVLKQRPLLGTDDLVVIDPLDIL